MLPTKWQKEFSLATSHRVVGFLICFIFLNHGYFLQCVDKVLKKPLVMRLDTIELNALERRVRLDGGAMFGWLRSSWEKTNPPTIKIVFR